MLSVNYKYLTLFLVALAIYLLWMDVSIFNQTRHSENTKYFNIKLHSTYGHTYIYVFYL